VRDAVCCRVSCSVSCSVLQCELQCVYMLYTLGALLCDQVSPVTRMNILQHSATHCNSHCNTSLHILGALLCDQMSCSVLQCVAV